MPTQEVVQRGMLGDCYLSLEMMARDEASRKNAEIWRAPKKNKTSPSL
jgi:hypothetical protein